MPQIFQTITDDQRRLEIEEERQVFFEKLNERVSMLTPEQEEDIQYVLPSIEFVKLSDYGKWFACLDEELTKRGL